ncbi:MAG: hypothetical protein IJV98_03130 [Clostridia bacterium]|nr:hypothetical protein [Clostridia bacterium]
MELIIPYLMCAAILAVLYVLMRLCLTVSNGRALRSVIKSGVYTKKTTYAALFAKFGSKKLRSHIYLPRRISRGVYFDRYEHVLVLSGGVAIVSLHVEEGTVHNPDGEELWHLSRRGRNGVEREFTFENPIAESTRRRAALDDLFSHAGLDFPIPVETLCVFLSAGVKFTGPRQEAILSPPAALHKLSELDTKQTLTENERKRILDVLRRYARSASYATAKNKRLQKL